MSEPAWKRALKKKSESDGKITKPKREKVKRSKKERRDEKLQTYVEYIQLFSTDKDAWKFSKQKQNWILKNWDNPVLSEDDLSLYLDSVQGGARDRMVQLLKKIVNDYIKQEEEAEKAAKEKEEADQNKEEKPEKKPKKTTDTDETGKKKKKEKKVVIVPITPHQHERSVSLLKVLDPVKVVEDAVEVSEYVQ